MARVKVDGSVIKITTYHTEHVPQVDRTSSCEDSVSLGKLSQGDYALIFDLDYLDKVNSIHYSVLDTISFRITGGDNGH